MKKKVCTWHQHLSLYWNMHDFNTGINNDKFNIESNPVDSIFSCIKIKLKEGH